MEYANFQCRNFASGCGVYVILIKRVRKACHYGHNNLAKLNERTSSICIGLSKCLTYGSGRTCSIIEELVFPFLF
jgi:hypothetical protein